MIIKYKKATSYGRERFYIMDFKIQRAYEALTGKSTLTIETIKALKDLGFKLEETNKVFKGTTTALFTGNKNIKK